MTISYDLPQQRSAPVPSNALDQLLFGALGMDASDLHLTVGEPPKVRVHGELEVETGFERNVMDEKFIAGAVRNIILSRDEARYELFVASKELDTAYALKDQNDQIVCRWRVNAARERGNTAVVMRAIPKDVIPLDKLKLPAVVSTFPRFKNGIVLVTGPTGSGKSTTLASIIDMINRQRKHKIITIEDPIEFVHESKNCTVIQREVGIDTASFSNALRAALRQDPEVILLGEMRDTETIKIALKAAETGHLVFATLHSQSAKDTITRVIDGFPDGEKNQIRVQLAGALRAVLTQTLCRKLEGGRVAATEIMIVNDAIRNSIRTNEIEQITNTLQTGRDDTGERIGLLLEESLAELVSDGVISEATAYEHAQDTASLRRKLSDTSNTFARAQRTSARFDS